MGTYIFLALLALVLGYGIVIYNGLVYLKNEAARSWSNIDILLKQRHDEIPKLVEVCKQYMQFERDTLERVMLARAGANSAREKGDIRAVGAAENALRAGLGSLFATVEAYPDLKANETLLRLMARITGLENAIADRREYYNEAANYNNVRIEVFPDVVVARLFAFRHAELLEFSAEETADVDVKALFRS